jgi:hypothetical protein
LTKKRKNLFNLRILEEKIVETAKCSQRSRKLKMCGNIKSLWSRISLLLSTWLCLPCTMFLNNFIKVAKNKTCHQKRLSTDEIITLFKKRTYADAAITVTPLEDENRNSTVLWNLCSPIISR